MKRGGFTWKTWAFLGAVAGGAWLILRPKPRGGTDAAKALTSPAPRNVSILTNGVRYFFAPSAAQANPNFFSQFKGRWQLTSNPFLVSNVWSGPSGAVVPPGVLISTAI